MSMAYSVKPSRAEVESASEDDSSSAKSCSGSNQRGTGPLKHLYDPVHREIVVDRSSGKDCLGPDREFNLQLVLDALPEDMTIRKLVLDGVLPLKSLKIPSGESQLKAIKELIIINSSLESTDDLFSSLAEVMPCLEELELSGSLLTHLKGADRLIGNGLKKLDVRGARIADIDAIVEIAKHVRAGTWTGKMSLEELDLRDNAIPR
jgi:Leucine-rich repeat (LRR) protein